MRDRWAAIKALGTTEAARMRWCRGCIYLGTAGIHGCCDYYEKTDERRPCPPGKECTAKVVPDGYETPASHIKFCQQRDAMERRQAERAEREANQQPRPRKKPGRKPKWDAEYGLWMYTHGYYLFEIAEVLGVDMKTVSSYSSDNHWKKYKPSYVHFHRHDMDEAKREYQLHLRDQAEREKLMSAEPRNQSGNKNTTTKHPGRRKYNDALSSVNADRERTE